MTAIVFAYHSVGVVGLKSLLAAGVDVKLVVTHQDDVNENLWFESVADLAKHHNIKIITPDNPNQADIIEQFKAINPDWIFSFYYRQMLSASILSLAKQGAYNLHGSLLPKYRGRAPVNWAVLKGEIETGVSLHKMVVKADAGDLVAQQAVDILPNDTAHQVFLKLIPAAEILLQQYLPLLLKGQLEATPLDLEKGSYFSGRQPEDGRIDWQQSAWQIHNLIRAVAPPYPPAFFDLQGQRFFILGSDYQQETALHSRSGIYWHEHSFFADCTDGRRFQIQQIQLNNRLLDSSDCHLFDFIL